MTIIPPHFNDRFITQRYNRALHFVQNLPATSNFQPSKSQKLQLYALFKQVSVGNVNTQRPGLFDVVGRAKWDAWKKLEGISVVEARHMYVEALLKCAAEAYKKNTGREEAQRIIRVFAMMRPSDDDDSDDLLDTDDTSNQEDDDTSLGSDEAEEKAYLRDIEESTGTPFVVPENTVSYALPDNNHHPFQQPRMVQLQSPITARPGSAASIQTMVTAPHQFTRPPSVANSNSRLGQHAVRGNERRNMKNQDKRNTNTVREEYIDNSINPWQQVPTKIYYPNTTIINEQQQPDQSPPLYPQHFRPLSASSSATATPRNRASVDSSAFEYTATVSLGPATKRALEALQNEVIALNDRIDDLRKELVESDRQRSIKIHSNHQSTSPAGGGAWKWILKVVMKYAGINLVTALVLLVILYTSKGPIAFTILNNAGLLKNKK